MTVTRAVAICVAYFVALLAIVVLVTSARGAGTKVDCGPEGRPVLDGGACIDREPVSIP
jgi:hypothetical protein